MTSKDLTNAYWSPERVADDPHHNPSADVEAGNKVVDNMTLNELVEFFSECTAGPTYCLVKERVIENIGRLPPRLNIRQAQTVATQALESIRVSIRKDSVRNWGVMMKRKVRITVDVEVDTDHVLSKNDMNTPEQTVEAAKAILLAILLGGSVGYDDFRNYFEELEGLKLIGPYQVVSLPD